MESTNLINNSEDSKINAGFHNDGDKVIDRVRLTDTPVASICTGDEFAKPEHNETTEELDVEPFANQSLTFSVNHQNNKSTSSETTTKPCTESSNINNTEPITLSTNPVSPLAKLESPSPQKIEVTGQEPYILYSTFQNTGNTTLQPLTLPINTYSIESTSIHQDGSATGQQAYILYSDPQNTVTKILQPLMLPAHTQLTELSVNQPHLSPIPNICTNPQSTEVGLLQLPEKIEQTGSTPLSPLVLCNSEIASPHLHMKELTSKSSEVIELKPAISNGGADSESMDIRTLSIGGILRLTGLSDDNNEVHTITTSNKGSNRVTVNGASQKATSDRSSQLCDENDLLEDEIKTALLYGSEPESNEESDEENCPNLKASQRMTYCSESSDSDGDDEESTSTLPPIHFKRSKNYGSKAVMPSSLFDFQWRHLPPGDRSDDPYLKKEDFLLTTGCTKTFSSPYEAFTSIWDRKIMSHIVKRTNHNASKILNQSGSSDKRSTSNDSKSWCKTDINELYAFFAANIACGFANNSEDIWSVTGSIVDTPNISNHLRYSRYTAIFKYLDYSNKSVGATNNLNHKEISIDTIRPVIDHLNLKFQSLYILDRNITINEISTSLKTQSAIDQLTKSASISGMRMHEVCDTKTGYMWRFEVNSSDQEMLAEEFTPFGTVYDMMLRIVKDLEWKGYTLWLHKLYTNPALFRRFKSLGFDVVGIMCKKLLPYELRHLSKFNMRRNDIFGCTSGDINILVWREKELAVVISTYHSDVMSTGESLTAKPMAVLDYDMCIKAVYSRNRLLAPYLNVRFKKGMHSKFFRWFLNMSIFNSYVLYTQSNGNDPVMNFKLYRLKLMDELFANHGKRYVNPEVPIKPIYRNKAVFTETVREHFPKHFSIDEDKSVHDKPECVLCKKYTVIVCPKCKVRLCLFTCYKLYHSQKNI